ncbi:MAG: Hsp20/alpha crystallin family protein [Armatimonadetes bacterium]|nr:Hsp20/alpha crystallin family protein [Armatimonadota bacterium]
MKSFRDIPTSKRGIPLFKPSFRKLRFSFGNLKFNTGVLPVESYSKDFIPPRSWVFSTKPKFKRLSGKLEQNLLIERLEEPKVDIIDEIKDLVIIMELPGIKEEDLTIKVEGDILLVLAKSFEVKYYKEILLPFKVKSANLFLSFKNGILEIKCFRK